MMGNRPPDRIDPRLPHEFEPSTFFPTRCIHCCSLASDMKHRNIPPRTMFTPEDEEFLRMIETTPNINDTDDMA